MNACMCLEFSALDDFDVPIFGIDDAGFLHYTNRASRALLESPPDARIDLRMMFPRKHEQQLARENLERSPQRGASYRTLLHRPWLGDRVVPIPVRIRAFPNTDEHGKRNGTIAFVDDLREKEVRAAINRAIAVSLSRDQLLAAVADEVRKLIPFDEFHVTMIGDSRKRMRELYASKNAKRHFRELVRWWTLPAFIRESIPKAVAELCYVDDMRVDPRYAALAKIDPDTTEFFALGVREFLSLPVRQDNQVVAFVALYSYRDHVYDETMLMQLKNLPLAEAVTAALHRDHDQRQQTILNLLQEMGQRATDIHDVAFHVVDTLLRQPGWEEWEHASIFLLDDQVDRLRLVCQATGSGPRLRKGFSMQATVGGNNRARLNNGPIAEAALDRRIVIRPSDRRDSPRANLPGFDPAGSLLALPVIGEGTRWVLFIESRVMNAFEDEEIEPLTTLAERAGAILAHSSLFELQTAVLGSIRDAVIEATDSGRIRWCNTAAQTTLGILPGATDAFHMLDLAGDANAKTLLSEPKDFYHREAILRPAGSEQSLPVLLSASKPANLSGRIYVVSDFTFQKEVQRLDELKEVFTQAALEGRVPLALASAWFEQHATGKSMTSADIEKILRQMARADLPLERLLRLSNQPQVIAKAPLSDLGDALAVTLDELPASLRDGVDVDACAGHLLVSSEFNDLQFCLESMISFGLRTRPESKKLRVAARFDEPNAVVEVEGDWIPSTRDGVALAATERWRRKTLYDLTLGDSVIQRIVERAGGRYEARLEQGLHLEISLPVRSGNAAGVLS